MASDYEIVANVIRPTPSAVVEPRDLWRAEDPPDGTPVPVSSIPGVRFELAKRLMPTPPAYVQLFDAVGPVEGFAPGSKRGRRLPAPAAAEILAWCRQFGLLGLLPQGLEAWSPIGGTPRKALAAAWPAVSGDPTSPEPGTARLEWPTPRTVSFTDPRWSLFFPYVRWNQRLTHPYPAPDMGGFWTIYGEPLEAFIGTAILLRNYLRSVAGDSQMPPSVAAWHLTNLVSSVVPVVGFAAGQTPTIVFQRRSTIASLAWLAVQDLSGGSLRVCQLDTCRRLFWANHRAQIYCNRLEQDRANKRAKRKANKEELM